MMPIREPTRESGDRTRADLILWLCAFLGARDVSAQCLP